MRLPLFIALLALLAPFTGSRAQDEPPRLYQVELILFRHLDPVARDAWTTERLSRVPRSARTLMPLDGETPPPEDFFRVADSEFRLANVQERLARIGDVQTLLHFGWRQTHELLRSGRRVRLDEEVDGLTGYLALRLGTRLVVELDLSLENPAAEEFLPPLFAWTEPAEEIADLRVPEAPAREGFRLHQRRTIRLGENHYFDHPAFGIILHVERVEPDVGAGASVGR